MNKIFIFLMIIAVSACSKQGTGSSVEIKKNTNMNDSINVSGISVKSADGKDISLSDYKGRVLLIVNVASECGYTPQYKALQEIYEKYKDRGFEILAFPCNDFGGQEPGTNEEIKNFCTTKYNVTFTLFDKIKILGSDKSPLYSVLINYPPSGDVSWNFEKFLIDKNGNVSGRFKSKIKPDSEEITSLIEAKISEN